MVCCIALFTFLFSLRLDETLTCSYWLIFAPLWFWKSTAIVGGLVGSVAWCRMSHRRFDRDNFIQFKAMLMSLCTNLLLLLFELAACEKLETDRDSPNWSLCFIPLYVLSLISIGSCIWSIRYERSYEIELFCSLNILQFVFVALRLDNTITWSWILVLIPVWILMCISFIVLLYLIVLTIIMTRTNHNLVHHHNNHPSYNRSKQKWANVFFYIMFVFGLVCFEIMITSKLDYEMPPTAQSNHYMPGGFYFGGINSQSNQFNKLNSIVLPPSVSAPATSSSNALHQAPGNFLQNSPNLVTNAASSWNKNLNSYNNNNNNNNNKNHSSNAYTPLSYFLVSVPLYFVYFSLLCLSFNNHSGNTFWFGMKMDFCEIFLAKLCPSCQTYGNVQLKLTKSDLFESNGLFLFGGDGSTTHNTNLNVPNATTRTANVNNNTTTVTFNTPLPAETLVVHEPRQKSILTTLKKKRSTASDGKSNQASVLTNYNLKKKHSKSNSRSLVTTNNANSSLMDFDVVDMMDNASTSMLNHANNSTQSQNTKSIGQSGFSMNSSVESGKKATPGSGSSRIIVDDCVQDEEVEIEVEEDEKKEASENTNKYTQHSLRSFQSAFNSDHLSVKSNMMKGANKNNSAVAANEVGVIPVIKSLDLPD